jgi:hypothetical protein
MEKTTYSHNKLKAEQIINLTFFFLFFLKITKLFALAAANKKEIRERKKVDNNIYLKISTIAKIVS